ncbi:hypothetical protein [Citricoccus sp.]|uniref:hypothetical protein n=1 Tax=Citricoccus sp. TaxID=1978372 RepID=UPI0028BE8CE2|nr:hypothetical protein [Citricoccus sp.]
MAKRTYTEEQRTEALRIYELEGPTAVQKKLGIPKNTVARWAKNVGVRTVRNAKTREATEAAQVDNAARRATIVSRLYGLAENTLGLLEKPGEYQTITKGSFGVDSAASLGFVPAQDKQREMTSLGIMLDKATVLEKVDNDNGTQGAKSMLDRLAHQLTEVPGDDSDPGTGGDFGTGGGEPEAAALPEEQP